MQNYNEQNQEYDYRGERGLILLRVSTEEQEKHYGFPSQLREVMEKVVKPRGIRISDPNKYIKYDTYTGMEFRERAILDEILRMAKNKEFDVLIMDVLDRLGRVGLPREIYRAELRMHGVRTLTTKPEEHADDDSLMGQMIRLLHGFKSEEERNDIIRRTQNGKRERVLKDHKLLGNHPNKYGWKYADEDKGAYILDEDPIRIELGNGRILRDENGEVWTKAKVRRRMFVWIEQGWTVRVIAAYLTSQHIPTHRGDKWDARLVKIILSKRDLNLTSNQPILAYGYIVVMDENSQPYTEISIAEVIYALQDKGLGDSKIAKFLNEKHIPTGRETIWLPATVNHMLSDEYVLGRAAAFTHKYVKKPGGKYRQFKRPKDEQLPLPDGVVPPILVTEDGKPDMALFERVQERKKANQKGARRNNQNPHNYVLRGGYIKCGYCGAVMRTASPTREKNGIRYRYICINTAYTANKCDKSNKITAHIADNYAWSKAVEIIRDPSQVDRKLEARRKADPNAERREYITGELAKIKASRTRLMQRLEDEDLDDESYADVKRRLKELADLKRGYEHELTLENNIHEEWKKIQEQLKNFHRKCGEYRDKIDDHNYEPDYEFKREAIEFFGIVVRVRKGRNEDRMEAESNPPSIVSNGSCT